jgi:multimeric flavodoxin WrbA
MKVLGICGSPRRGGNTELLLDRALEGATSAGAEVEKVILNELNFSPCQECGDCDETGECTTQDDMQALYQKLEEADGIILASPIFFGSLSAQTKMMIDRFQCWWAAKYLLKKPRAEKRESRRGIFICVGGMKREDFFQAAVKLVKIWFTNINVVYEGDLFYPGIDEKGVILGHLTALKDAFAVGKDLAKKLR